MVYNLPLFWQQIYWECQRVLETYSESNTDDRLLLSRHHRLARLP
jgi:hypothetical protein